MAYTWENFNEEFDCVRFYNISDPVVAARWIYTDIETFLLSVVIPIVSAVGVVGNVAFLFMLIRLPQMRTSLSSYLAVLALCDILFLLIANILYAITLGQSDVSLAWPAQTPIGCAISVVSSYVWYFASLGLITLISLERYFAICHPLKHIHFQGKKRNAKLILAVLVFSVGITISVTPRYTWYHTYCLIWPNIPDFQNHQKTVGVCGTWDIYWNVYEGFLLTSVFIISAFINCFLYAKILLAVSSRGVLTTSQPNPESNRVRNQVARTLIINGVVFFICQAPFRIDNLDDALEYLDVDWDLIKPSREAIVTTVGQAFLFLNSVVNPFIYVLSSGHYRQGMIEAFSWKRKPVDFSLKKVATGATKTSRIEED
ncbi:somatostatin receptor type 2-like [Amphiura filiformis]|uniref:somatostatin receptor type 2-like n=1 Tax=Amphiura filiformis TaxID=82378 RepID=UPI003B21969B